MDLKLRMIMFTKNAQKRFACLGETLFQLFRAVAIDAGPGLLAVPVAAGAAVVGILNLHQLEVFLPVWPLFLKRRAAETRLHPAGGPVGAGARRRHVAEIFVSGDRTLPKGAVGNGVQQRLFMALAHAGSHQVTH